MVSDPKPLAWERRAVSRLGGATPQLVVSLPFPTNRGLFWNTQIGTTPQLLLNTQPGPDLERLSLLIFNSSGNTIFVGGSPSDVLGTMGFPLLAGLGITMDGYTGEVWLRATVAGSTVGVIEMLRPPT